MTTHPHHRKHLASMIHKHTEQAIGNARRAANINVRFNAPAAAVIYAIRADRGLADARELHARLRERITHEADPQAMHLLVRAEAVAAARIANAERVVAQLRGEVAQ